MEAKPKVQSRGLPLCSPMAAATALLFLLLLFLLPISHSSDPAPSSEVDALLRLKASFTNATALASWTPVNSSGPCDRNTPWDGVICRHGFITGIHLSGMGLSGTINVDALSHLASLRRVSFINNFFSGPIPAFDRLHSLKSILLSSNRFAGPIPGDFFDAMTRLKKLWLNSNSFTGPIPVSLSKATALLELHLEDNHFDGQIPALDLPSLSSFNVSNNELDGPIPETYAKFNAGSFSGNEGLCGELVGAKPCEEENHEGSGGVAAFFVLAVFLAFLGMYSIKTRDNNEVVTLGVARKESEAQPSKEEKSTAGGPDAGGYGEGEKELVMVNESRGKFGLSDLMKAEAEVMGNGGHGSAYRVVMVNGVVVVKRMEDMNRVGKESFDAEMARLGRLSHPNVLPPLAYHYRKDEKLLVLEFVPKGSLMFVLHGDRGSDHAALDWMTRLNIARGVARGLEYLHAELPFNDAPHGNLKSGNVLLSSSFEPLLADYGFLPMMNPARSAIGMQALNSPEVLAGRPVTPRSDVYCLGVLLLELLTGKFPTQYLMNVKGGTDVVQWATDSMGEGREAEILDPYIVEGAKASVPEMARLVRVAVECAEPEPDRRLGLKEAVERIEDVAAAEAKRAGAAAAATPTLSQAEYVRERSARRIESIGERSAQREDGSSPFAM